MKNRFTKVVSLLLSAVMTVSAMSLTSISSYAETNEITGQTSETNGSDLQYGGLLGTMLSDELNESAEEKKEAFNSDYVIYKLDYDKVGKSVGVNYHAISNCTIFVGFYNDEGTELITSVTKELAADDSGYTEVYVYDALPSHYLIKAFIVDTQLLNPVTKPYVYNKCTEQMQEILNKTTENFEEYDIVNLDDKNNNNFVVLQEGVKKITPTDSTDIYKGEDENGNYIFENAVDIAALQKGDKAFVTCSPDMIAFKVKEIKSDGEKTIVSHEDVQIDEFIKFLKMNSDEYTGDKYNKDITKVELEENGAQLPQPFSPNSEADDPYSLQLPEIKSELSAKIDDYIDNENDFEFNSFFNSTGVCGNFSLKEEGHIELYFEAEKGKDAFCSATVDIKVKVYISIGISVELFSFPKFWTRYPVFLSGLVNIYFDPKFSITAQGEGELGYEREFHLNCDTKNGIDFSITDPVTTKLSGKVTIELSIDLAFELDIAIFTIFKITPRGGIRLEIESGSEVSKGEKITGHIDSENVNITKEEPYERHDCENCCNVKLSFFIELDIVFCIEIFGLDDLGVEWIIHVPIWETEPLKFHINEDGFHKDECPNKSHRIILNVYDVGENKETKGKPVKNAKLFVKDDDGNYVQLRDDEGNEVKTNDEGKAEVWIKDEVLKKSTCIIKAEESNNRGEVAVGKLFDIKLKKPNKFEILLNNYLVDNPYPKKGKCGMETEFMHLYILDGPNSFEVDGTYYYRYRNGVREEYKRLDNYFTTSYGYVSDNYFILHYSEYDPSVQYVLEENGEMRVDGDGVVDFYFIQRYSKKDKIDIVRIGPGVKAFVELYNRGTDDAYQFGISLKDIEFKDMQFINFGHADETEPKPYKVPSTISELYFEGDNGKFITDGFAYGNEYIKKVELSLFKTIGKEAFYNCTNLSEINMPSTLKEIGESAFSNCAKLEDVVFYDGLETIGKNAFKGTAISYIDIPSSVTSIGAGAFNNTPLIRIAIRNRDCILGNSFIPENTTVYGYMNSTAHKYVINNPSMNLKFVPFDPETPDTVTPKATTLTAQSQVATTTTVTTTTAIKTATVVTTNVEPDADCIFVAVENEDTITGSAEKLFEGDNVKFFDQQTANEEGVVSFSYLPADDEKWFFVFVSQAINDVITRTFGTPEELSTTRDYIVRPENKGDANGDGGIDMADVVIIMQALSNPNKYGINGTAPSHITERGFWYGDADQNGLTVNDALRIQQYLLGIIPSLA